MRNLVNDSIFISWIVMVFKLSTASVSKHPDCLDPTLGQGALGDCGWKYHRAVTNRLDDGNNSCIPCYTNACIRPNAKRCRTECPKYWSLCINYAGFDGGLSLNSTQTAPRIGPPRITSETVNVYLNSENIILIVFAIFLIVGATGFGIYRWRAGDVKSTDTKERLPYVRVICKN